MNILGLRKMKVNEIFESVKQKADDGEELYSSIKDGEFTKDGKHLRINGMFSCYSKGLTSLVGAPSHVEEFSCSGNKLTSLEGAPVIILRSFHCHDNRLTSLHNIHKQITMCKLMDFANNPIKSHVLGLLKIKGLDIVMFNNVSGLEKIISKYLPEGDLIECQQELIEAGLEEYAQL